MTDEERAREIVDSLFVNGAGEVATRLVLVDDNTRNLTRKDLGGWCREALYDKVSTALAAERERYRPAIELLRRIVAAQEPWSIEEAEGVIRTLGDE